MIRAIPQFGRTTLRTVACRVSMLLVLSFLSIQVHLFGCTGIYIKGPDRILIGNNEDGSNPVTRIWTVPAEKGSFGRLYFGFNDLSAQGGINEKGLWFDAFGLSENPTGRIKGEIYPGDLQDLLMAKCATTEDVLRLLSRYNRSQMTRYQWMFGDREGHCMIVESDTVIPMQGNYQVVTNFRQSQFPEGEGFECNRFRIVREMMKADAEPGIGSLRRILSAVHSEGQDVTQYSYIADLVNGIVYVYHFHNFENVVVLNVRDELAKGKIVYDLPVLFPRTHAFESFDWQARHDLQVRMENRLFKTFDITTYPDYYGKYVVTLPEVMRDQVITISTGTKYPGLQLNEGHPFDIFPSAPGEFVLMNYGGLELDCLFPRDPSGKVKSLALKSDGFSVEARRIE